MLFASIFWGNECCTKCNMCTSMVIRANEKNLCTCPLIFSHHNAPLGSYIVQLKKLQDVCIDFCHLHYNKSVINL